MQEISIRSLVVESYRTAWDHRSLLVRAAGLWISLSIINTGLIIASVGFEPIDPFDPAFVGPPALLWLSLTGMLLSVFGPAATIVFWHGYLLRHRSDLGLAAPLNRQVFRYVWLAFIVGLLALVPCVFVFVVAILSLGGDVGSSVGILVALALVLWLMARLILVFPAAAIGERKLGINQSFRATKGATGPIFVGILATVLPFLVIGMILNSIVSAVGAEFSLLSALVQTVIGYIQACVCATLMSLIFKHYQSQPGLSTAD